MWPGGRILLSLGFEKAVQRRQDNTLWKKAEWALEYTHTSCLCCM